MKGLPYSLSRAGIMTIPVQRLRFPFRGLVIPVTDPGAANAPFTFVLGGLPQGNVHVHRSLANLRFTKGSATITDTFAGNIALGTAPTADATLAGAEVDLAASQALVTGVAGVSAGNRVPGVGALFDNTDGAMEINLNGFLTDASISATSSLVLDGVLDVLVSMLLDD